MPRVSVIINVYNGASTLAEAIESVLAQTFRDWELIVWDDCSVDSSVAIAASYDDRRIRHFSSERNQGLGRSRIAALRQASGEWFAFVDQDDLWTAEKLSRQIEKAESNPDAGFIYGRALTFFPNGRRVDYDHRHEYRPLPDGDIFERLFIDSCFIAVSSVLFRRQAFDAIPVMPSDISTCPDYYLYLALSKEYRVVAVQEVVCHYRIHAGNMTRSHGQRMQREILRLIHDWSDFLPAGLAAKRLRVHSTVLAMHQMRTLEGFSKGVKTLLTEGAMLYLLSRPFARVYRSIRRLFSRPYWQRQAAA